jgi:hypothetical protein
MEIDAARTHEELYALEERSNEIAEDQGKVAVKEAFRTRHVELAIAGGEAVGIREHRRALADARTDELRKVIRVILDQAKRLEREATEQYSKGEPILANRRKEDAKLIRAVAERVVVEAS